jgi:hypothetical protein
MEAAAGGTILKNKANKKKEHKKESKDEAFIINTNKA